MEEGGGGGGVDRGIEGWKGVVRVSSSVSVGGRKEAMLFFDENVFFQRGLTSIQQPQKSNTKRRSDDTRPSRAVANLAWLFCVGFVEGLFADTFVPGSLFFPTE